MLSDMHCGSCRMCIEMALVRRRDYLRWALHSIYANAHNKVLHYKTVDIDGRMVESYMDESEKWFTESAMHPRAEIHEATVRRHLLGVAYSQHQVVETSPRTTSQRPTMPKLHEIPAWPRADSVALRAGLPRRVSPSLVGSGLRRGDREATARGDAAYGLAVCA